MSRSQRLLDLLQALHGHRRPVTAQALADKLGVSTRTLYRDIATLRDTGAPIEGEAGIGYVLRPGHLLPPLMFSPAEIDALVLGARWVSEHTDPALAEAARDALAKIAAVLPTDPRDALGMSPLLVAGPKRETLDPRDLGSIRAAINEERKVALTYRDKEDKETQRVVWPFALGFFTEVRLLVAWCETREDFRNFRLDRITKFIPREDRYPRGRRVLLADWRQKEGIPDVF
ncbi:MAG: YafY family transcriptional regulator [Rhodospirillum sp.]|nr:YafY family transcriptional regulator [Rhodospirillum sp.]MCF8491535.1 YafY family transcriptional regulator [Rhodospirillum sp.]MCF8501415.1 YafY family transcriptional regulator [Rhodospirillum sp.]